MAFDGGFLHKLITELKSAKDCHIDKIYQPSRDELVFLLRKKGFVKRLLISVRSGSARLHFTEEKYENPDTPPMFCMLVRKHLSGARLIDIIQNDLERIAELIFSATNELGDRVEIRLICEFIGNQSNIILVNSDEKIIDAIRRSDIENASRFIQPGAKYEYPKSLDKLNPLKISAQEITSKIYNMGELPLWKAILDNVQGFSPIIAREIAYRCGGDILTNEAQKETLEARLEKTFKDLSDFGKPYMLKTDNGVPYDFCYTEIKQYGEKFKCDLCESYSKLLDDFYAEKQRNALVSQGAADIIKTVSNAINRIQKKLSLRLCELGKCKDREKYRIYGELIKANLYAIENGSSSAVVQNYYDEQLSTIKIPLNPAISPSANAARYFKEYKKTYTAEQTLLKLTEEDKKELLYLESVADSISRCESISEISEIRDELSESGYIRRTALKGKKKKQQISSYLEYTSKEGYKIAVGKNNRQNDYLTCVLANKNDLWFHVKNIPGSHVIVFCGGEQVSDETVLFAAGLAAENSKAASSSNVAVDYTPVKYVKKPNGAKPGMVIYTTNKTVFVTPEGEK